MKTTTLQIRISPSLKKRALARSRAQGYTVTDVLTQFLRDYASGKLFFSYESDEKWDYQPEVKRGEE